MLYEYTASPPAGHPVGGKQVLVEAAGQLVHLFRGGLDYAFILQAGCGACYSSMKSDES